MNAAEALSSFAHGRLTIAGLQQELRGLVALDYSGSATRTVHVRAGAKLPTVIFSRADITQALGRLLAFQITEEELSDWAATIRLLDSHFDLERTDPSPDDVWNIIDRLAVPSVWGDLSRATVGGMLLELRGTPGLGKGEDMR